MSNDESGLFEMLRINIEREVRRRLENEITKPIVWEFERKVRNEVRKYTEQVTIEGINKMRDFNHFREELIVKVKMRGDNGR